MTSPWSLIRRSLGQVVTGALTAVASIAAALTILITTPAPVTAQTPALPDRGAFVGVLGSDTILIDRFERAADTLRGNLLSVHAGRCLDYEVVLAPGGMVRTLHVRQVAAGAGPGVAPMTELTATLHGDSVLIELDGKSSWHATKADAIPTFLNAMAIQELFTRRAHSAGYSSEAWYLAVFSGTTSPVMIRPISTDSLLFTVAGQQTRYRVDAEGRIIGGLLVGQPYTITRVTAAQADRMTHGPDYSAPPGAPYTAEEVAFKGPGGSTLGGTLTMPRNARGRLPAIVTITGSGQSDRDEYEPAVGGVRLFRQVADTLSRVGIAVLRLDDRGIGGSNGPAEIATSADFADDIRAALAWLRTRRDIDPNRLALVGHSEGGMIAPMIAATDPRLRAIVAMAGPASMMDVLIWQKRWWVDHNPDLSPAQRDSIVRAAPGLLAQATFPPMKFWVNYDPVPVTRRVKAATLILQGATDQQVPMENAAKLATLIRAGGNRDVTVRIFPLTDHLFLTDTTGDPVDMYRHVKTNVVSPVILGALADWLVVKLKARVRGQSGT